MRKPRRAKAVFRHVDKHFKVEKRGSTRRFCALLQCESLEGRNLLSVTMTPELQVESVNSATISGLTASEVKTAYGFNSVSGNGAGQTIAIIDAYNDPDIKSDLSTFDSAMGLPAANLTVVNQDGGSSLPQTNSSWDLEISLDVEWAHAIAPDANILLVEANSDSLTDLLSAVQYATTVSSVSVVSMSWGTSEFSSETSYDSYFTTPAGHQGITFVGASGDSGSPGIWPAMSTNVLAVGGTTLSVSSTGTYEGETAWSDSGGGTSLFESEPSWQTSVQSTGKRTSPDVSYDANPNTGFAVYDSVATDGQSGWFQVGGTSDAAPQWAALLAIANQGRVADGETTLNGAQAAIYSLPSSDFHDITSGSNGGYSATTGYDEVTGRGSPIANLVIAGLESYTTGSSGSDSGSGSSGSGSSGSGSSGSGSSGSGSSGSGGGSSGGSHGHTIGGHYAPYGPYGPSSGSSGSSGSNGSTGSSGSGGFSGFNGFGFGFGGFSGFGGLFNFGGRLDEIGPSGSTAVVDAFVTTELAMSDTTGSQAIVASNSLAGIQPTLAAPNSAATASAVSTSSSGATADHAPARAVAFATVENTAENTAEIDDGAAGDFHASGAVNGAFAQSGASINAAASSAASLRAAGGATSAHSLDRQGSGAATVELSPALREAVWTSLDLEFDDPAALAIPAGAEAAIDPKSAPENGSAMSYSSPLAMVLAGVALEWARSEAEDRLKPPSRPWPGRRAK